VSLWLKAGCKNVVKKSRTELVYIVEKVEGSRRRSRERERKGKSDKADFSGGGRLHGYRFVIFPRGEISIHEVSAVEDPL